MIDEGQEAQARVEAALEYIDRHWLAPFRPGETAYELRSILAGFGFRRSEVPEPSGLPTFFGPKSPATTTLGSPGEALTLSDDEKARADAFDEYMSSNAQMIRELVQGEPSSEPQGEPSDAEIIQKLRDQIEEARTAWWSAVEQGDDDLIYTDRIEDAMDEIWSAIGDAEWTPGEVGGVS